MLLITLICNRVEVAQSHLPDPVDLAATIDEFLSRAWVVEQVEPSGPSDDAMFLRRISLDLIGRIPTVMEVREFLSDNSPGKRAKAVFRLVDSNAHYRHMATFWRREWIPQVSNSDDVDAWLAFELGSNAPYDQIVRELLSAESTNTGPGAPNTFLAASEFKPENLAANTTRAFLGINLDCAQCHNHPFARWTREQFWQTAAFFGRQKTIDGKFVAKTELKIPNTDQVVTPMLLTDPQPTWSEFSNEETGRGVLSAWVTSRDNPYFARNAVNRLWSNFFGIGLVEPLDDLSGENPASHPELLDELAMAFADSNFNLKYLTAAMVLTKGYQLSSVASKNIAPRLFARSAVRGLTGEQLYESLRVAAGLEAIRDDLDPINSLSSRKLFAEKFRVDRVGTAQRSILQSLSLMNGESTTELTKIETTPTLRGIASAPFLDTPKKVEALYLTALGRVPSSQESALIVKYVDQGGVDENGGKALADVFWALLNSSEFSTNH